MRLRTGAGIIALVWAIACVCGIANATGFDFTQHSDLLTAFFGHPVTMRAEILTPDDFDVHAARPYPTIYYVHPFGGTFRPPYRQYEQWRAAIARAPEPFVVVFLDATQPSGHDEFADSANDGPWATALLREFIPALERRFDLDPHASGRFLAGHSSGGWSVLWLQTTYPHTFGGAWAIAPDPVDFHDFLGPDLLAPDANFYTGPHGPWPFVRVNGRDTSTLRAYVRAQGDRSGGQFDSFEAVFSPRGPDGKPERLFDRATGAIDPTVAAYWEAHDDIAARVARDWATLGPALAGKLNIFVGTEDTFHLESSVARFARELRALGSDARVTFAPECDHWSIFESGGGLIARIVREASATRARYSSSALAFARRASIHARKRASAPCSPGSK